MCLKNFFFVCQITVKYTNVNIKNSEDPLSTHFFKIRLEAQPGFTRVKPMGKPGEIWALRTLPPSPFKQLEQSPECTPILKQYG